MILYLQVIMMRTAITHSYNAYYTYGTGDQLYAVEDQNIYKSGMRNWEPTCINSDPLLADLDGFDWPPTKWFTNPWKGWYSWS